MTTTKPTQTVTEESAPQAVVEESAPQPTPSKSNSNRLSVFIEKAKHLVADKKHAPTTEEAPAETHVPEEITEHEVDPKSKSEKRKSILGGIFRTKSPVKEIEDDVPPKGPVAENKTSPEIVQEPIVSEPTTSGAIQEPDVPREEHTEAHQKEHKDNVIDQIKRKFFNKKKETKEEEVSAADPEHETPRPSSPLGRSLTHLFRGISTKPKKAEEPKEESKEEPKEEPKEEHREEPKDEPVLDTPSVAPTPATTVRVN